MTRKRKGVSGTGDDDATEVTWALMSARSYNARYLFFLSSSTSQNNYTAPAHTPFIH